MSYNTLAVQAQDVDLYSRIDACVQQEAQQPVHDGDPLAKSIRAGYANITQRFTWPVCTATEAAYASALAAGIKTPGKDESVITDGAILSAVQAAWDDILV